MLLIASIVAVVVKLSYITVKHTSDSYLQERAELFMRSVIENTLLAIEGYDRKGNNKCAEHLSFKDEDERFVADVDVLKYYCYDGADCPCSNRILIKTPQSHGYVLLKVTVKNTANIKNGDKKILLEKITLQRP